MDKDKRGYIRYLHNTLGKSISAIARELGIARQTVRRALNEQTNRAKNQRPSKLDPYKKEIKRLLEANPNITNVLILEKIRQLGYEGGRSILGDYLRKLRPKVRESYLPIETMPGEQAQVDWAYAGEIAVGEHKRKLYIFCMILSYSRHFYFEPTVSMKQDIFLACHINAFRFFGGVPKNIVYDNLKSVVLSRLGNDIHYNPSMLDFAAYYGFKLKVCNPRAPHEKGKVERIIAYITNNFMQKEEYHDFKHIRSEALLWLKNTACKRKHSTTGKVPIEEFEKKEKAFLLKLPQKAYDYAAPKVIHPQKDGLFRFDANRYSVP
ncbi:MAG TPA: IS21 family transposase [Desulfobacteraceae bacterium]|nr:IS21 family transposase [Desulfobacteraceae bacterium]